MQKLIIIIGPTASKKTTLAHELCQQINGSIINGDVFQMYQELNVGINKPSKKNQEEINYYLIDKLKINDSYSIHDFQHDFESSYNQIINKKQIPILCGGSHLYIDSIVKGYDLSDKNIQNEHNKIVLWSNEELANYLKKYDLNTYSKTINNRHRQIRAVAYLKTHNNKPKQENEQITNNCKYDVLTIMVNKDRNDLYTIINNRTEQMLSNDKWKNEVKSLIDKYGLDIINFQSFKAIGYKEIYQSIINDEQIDIEKIKQKTRHLAKHQLTWCNNKFDNKIIFEYGVDNIDFLVKKINNFFHD